MRRYRPAVKLEEFGFWIYPIALRCIAADSSPTPKMALETKIGGDSTATDVDQG